MDFQMYAYAEFENEMTFARSFGDSFLREIYNKKPKMNEKLQDALFKLKQNIEVKNEHFALKALFENISDIGGRLYC